MWRYFGTPEDLECIQFPETGNNTDRIEGGLTDALKQLKQVLFSGFFKSLFICNFLFKKLVQWILKMWIQKII